MLQQGSGLNFSTAVHFSALSPGRRGKAPQFAEAQTVVAEPVGVPPLIGRVGRLFDQALFT